MKRGANGGIPGVFSPDPTHNGRSAAATSSVQDQSLMNFLVYVNFLSSLDITFVSCRDVEASARRWSGDGAMPSKFCFLFGLEDLRVLYEF